MSSYLVCPNCGSVFTLTGQDSSLVSVTCSCGETISTTPTEEPWD